MGFLNRFKAREASTASSTSSSPSTFSPAEHLLNDGRAAYFATGSERASPASSSSHAAKASAQQRSRAVTDPIYARSLASSSIPYVPSPASHPPSGPFVDHASAPPHSSSFSFPVAPANYQNRTFVQRVDQDTERLDQTPEYHFAGAVGHATSNQAEASGADGQHLGASSGWTRLQGDPHNASLKSHTAKDFDFDDVGDAEEVLEDEDDEENSSNLTDVQSASLRQAFGITHDADSHSSPRLPLGVMSDTRQNVSQSSFESRTYDSHSSTVHGYDVDLSMEQSDSMGRSSFKKKWQTKLLPSARRPRTADGTQSRPRLDSPEKVERLSTKAAPTNGDRKTSSLRLAINKTSTDSLTSMSHALATDRWRGKRRGSEQDYTKSGPSTPSAGTTSLPDYSLPAGLPISSSQTSLVDEDEAEGPSELPPSRMRRMSSSASHAFSAGLKQARSRSGTMANLFLDMAGPPGFAESNPIDPKTPSVSATRRSSRSAEEEDETTAKETRHESRHSQTRSINARPSYDSSVPRSSLQRSSAEHKQAEQQKAFIPRTPSSQSLSATETQSLPRRKLEISTMALEAALTKLGPIQQGGLASSDMTGRILIICQVVKEQATQAARTRAGQQYLKRRAGRPHTSQGQVQATSTELEDEMSALEQKTEERMRRQIVDGVVQTIDYHSVHLAAAFIEARRQMEMCVTPWRIHAMFHLTDVQPTGLPPNHERSAGKASMSKREQVNTVDLPAPLDLSFVADGAGALSVTAIVPASLSPAPRRKRAVSSKRREGSTSTATSNAAVLEYEQIRRQAAMTGSPMLNKQALISASLSAQDKIAMSALSTSSCSSSPPPLPPLPLAGSNMSTMSHKEQSVPRNGSLDINDVRTEYSDSTSRRDSTTTNNCMPLTPPANSSGFSSIGTLQTSADWGPVYMDESTMEHAHSPNTITITASSSPLKEGDEPDHLDKRALSTASHVSSTASAMQVLTPEAFSSRHLSSRPPSSRGRRLSSFSQHA